MLCPIEKNPHYFVFSSCKNHNMLYNVSCTEI